MHSCSECCSARAQCFSSSYSFSPFWEGGTYGSRYLSETMPIIAYFLNYAPILQPDRPKRSSTTVLTVIFVVFVAVGVFRQVTAIVGGHLGQSFWVGLPYFEIDLPEDRHWAYMREAPMRNFETRLWNIRDGLEERIWRGVYSTRFLMSPRIVSETNYAARCKATVLSVRDTESCTVDEFKLKIVGPTEPLVERVGAQFNDGRKFVHVRVRNDGEVPLYGFETGIQWGFAAMANKVINEEGKTLHETAPFMYEV